MNIRLSVGFVVAFISLRFVMHEAHELVHTLVGRIICGCWGPRDFNVWFLCEGCYAQNQLAVLAIFAGPVFTFVIIWIGIFLLNPYNNDSRKSLGFALIFANNPFARIFTAAMGKGDEISGLYKVIGNYPLAWTFGLLIVSMFTLYPLYCSFKTIQRKNRVGYFILFLLSGIFLDLLFVFGLMNKLLKNGVLSDTWILGSPIIVTVFTAVVLAWFIAARRKIYTLAGG